MRALNISVTAVSLFFIHSLAFAQAGTDCQEQAKYAVENCKGRIDGARNSDVSSFGGGGSMNGGGNAQAGAAYAVMQRLQQGISACQSTDMGVCENQCNKALSAAQHKNPPDQALIQKIKKNMQSCVDGIDQQVASAQQSQQGLRTAASESNETAERACNEGEACGTPDPNLQQANSPCPAGMFWSVRWNQCAGIGAFTPRDMIPTPFKASK